MNMFRKEGDRIIVRETGEPARLFFVENFGFSHFPNGEMLKFIDAVANNGANGIRVFGFFPMGKGREEEPYPRPGGHFGLNSGLNDAYVNYLHQWMDRAQDRGIVILYELFDSIGLKYHKIARYHPLGQFTIGGGFLSYGPYVTGYPVKPLDVYFGIFIDNNTDDDLPILVLDVYDAPQQRLLAQEVITRRQFSRVGEFSLLKLSFTPTAQSTLEFRIYFYGYAQVTVKANYIAVVEPEKLQLHTYQDLEKLFKRSDQNIIIRESLKDGRSEGLVREYKEFTAEGLQFQGGWWSLRYSIPTTPNGYAEFSAKGFVHDELHGGTEFKPMLFSMWNGDEGYDYDRSSHIYELRKFGYIQGHHDANALDLRLKVGPEEEDWNHGKRYVPDRDWDPNKTYRFRIEWGNGQTTVYLDGEVVSSATYHGEFAPSNQHIQIGANAENTFRARWKQTPHDLLISDVVIGKLPG